MKPGSTAGPRRRARRLSFRAAALAALPAVLLVGCGITLGSGAKGSEFFSQLVVRGELTTGSELTVGLDYAQPYDRDVQITCDLLTLDAPKSSAPPQATAGATSLPPAAVPIPRPKPNPSNFVLEIMHKNVGPNEHGGLPSEVTPVLGSTSEKFRAPDQPGRYRIWCYTTADQNNEIRTTIRIEQGPPPTATP